MFVYFCSFVGVSITFSYFLSKEIVNEIFVWLYCFYSIAFTKKHNRYTEAVSFIMTEVFFHIQWQMQIWKKMPFDIYDFCFFDILQQCLQLTFDKTSLSLEVYTEKGFINQTAREGQKRRFWSGLFILLILQNRPYFRRIGHFLGE